VSNKGGFFWHCCNVKSKLLTVKPVLRGHNWD
jgi:hypothetical protein